MLYFKMHDELRRVPKTSLSIVSAYFTINAYNALKESLDKIDGLRFLFGEPENSHYPHTSQISHISYLDKQHGISTETIYNDLHGFIGNFSVLSAEPCERISNFIL